MECESVLCHNQKSYFGFWSRQLPASEQADSSCSNRNSTTWRVGPADPTRLAIGRASHRSAVYIKLKLDCRDSLSTVLGLLSLDGGAVRDQSEPLDVTLLAIMQLQHTAITYSGMDCIEWTRQNLIGTVGHRSQQAVVVILCNKITTENQVPLHIAHRPDVVHKVNHLVFVFANDCVDLFKVLAFFPNAE